MPTRTNIRSQSMLIQHVPCQILVKLNNGGKSHLLRLSTPPTPSLILSHLSHLTNIPINHLRLLNYPALESSYHDASSRSQISQTPRTPPPLRHPFVAFLSAITTGIQGGKGGFGTLLKGQSKMAAATRTLDFGACRDLNGRRLRHVNDEIKLRRWRELQKLAEQQQQQQGGRGGDGGGSEEDRDRIDIERGLDGMRTASGIKDWHLGVPGWSEVSGKERMRGERMWRKEIRKAVEERNRERLRKEAIQQERERVVREYASRTVAGGDGTMGDAVRVGMMRKKRKIGGSYQQRCPTKLKDESNVAVDVPTTVTARSTALPYLHILSGSFDIDTDGIVSANTFTIRSNSVFTTVAIALNPPTISPQQPNPSLYYETTILSGGISQLGWAHFSPSSSSSPKPVFFIRPNSDTGDGVGDDAFSYGYDGFRALAFHDGTETPYGRIDDNQDAQDEREGEKKGDYDGSGGSGWNEGDVIGCLYEGDQGKIRYFVNGTDLGVAFTIDSQSKQQQQQQQEKQRGSKGTALSSSCLVPAWSMDQDETLSINVGPDFRFPPSVEDGKSVSIIGVGTILAGDKEGGSGMVDTVDTPSTTNVREEGTAATVPPTTDQDPVLPISKKNGASSKASEKQPKQQSESPPEKPFDSDQSTNAGSDSKPQPTFIPTPTLAPQITIDWTNHSTTLAEIETMGMDRLKQILMSKGCKCGGTLTERAQRLVSIRGLERKDYPMKARGKNFVV